MPIIVNHRLEPAFFSRRVEGARRFFLQVRPDKRSPLTVVSGGWERCGRDYVINRDSFYFLALEFVAAGEVSLRLDGRDHHLSAGAVFTYGPGIAQRLRIETDESAHKYFVNFAGARAKALLLAARLEPGQVRQVPNLLGARELFDVLIEAGLRRTKRAPAICASLLEALLLAVGDSAVAHGPHRTRSFATYRRCLDWIDRQGGRVRTLQEAAHGCHVDGAYLCRLFRQFGDETPYQLIQRLRLQRAAELLHEPTSMVKTVAADLGFADPFHFSRAFKRFFGVSPTELIKQSSRGRG